MMYYAAFDTSALSLGTLTLTRAANPNVVIDLDDINWTSVDGVNGATIFFHVVGSSSSQRVNGHDSASTVKLGHYAKAGFATVLEEYLELEADDQGWADPEHIDVSHTAATGVYTISSSYAIGYSFSLAAGAALLGFSSMTGGAATAHQSDVMPTYTISPTLPSVSLDSPLFEPPGVANHVETDGGEGGGMTRSLAPHYRRFRQEYETKEKTIRASAAASHPWTFQDLVEWCRGQYAFIVFNGFGSATHEAHMLRTASTSWNPQRHGDGNDAQFFVEFDCVALGVLENF